MTACAYCGSPLAVGSSSRFCAACPPARYWCQACFAVEVETKGAICAACEDEIRGDEAANAALNAKREGEV